jgi:hypothetical protein
MNKSEVIDKIRKLLALSESPNENEAALAAEKAREMLSRYNLGMADLSIGEIKSRLEITEKVVEDSKILQDWVQNLISYVGEAFDCHCMVNNKPGRRNKILFIGSAEDAEVAVYVFQYLRQTLRVMARNRLKELKTKNPEWSSYRLKCSYLEGAVRRIGERLRTGAQKLQEEEKAVCTDLIVVKSDEVQKYVEKKFRNCEQFGFRSETINEGAYRIGYADAESIQIRTALES